MRSLITQAAVLG